MRTIYVSVAAIALALSWPVSGSAKDKGFYIGGSIGSADVSEDSVNFDENDFAWKAFAGYQIIGLLAVEGGYVDFGSPSDSNLKLDPSGWDAFGVLGLPIGPVRLFGKLGAIYWDADSSDISDDDGTDLAAGIGLDFELFGLAVRGEVEYFDALDDIYMLSVGATYTF
ncbi:MAG: outer membrane beta-barrel protein [Gammaproteobacteria bacterium]|jgi:hypothetical protein